jgi:hypothetical protein
MAGMETSFDLLYRKSNVTAQTLSASFAHLFSTPAYVAARPPFV